MVSSLTENEEGDKDIVEEKTPGLYLRARHVLGFMGFMGIFNVYSTRNNLSVAIVAMVNSTAESVDNSSDICPERGIDDSIQPNTNGVFDWDEIQQGLILGAYYYGYIFSNIPGAWLSRRFGFKIVMGVAMLVSSVLTLITPVSAYASFNLFVAVRILLGLAQGVCSPSMHGAWEHWSPPLERTTLVAFHMSGASFGTFIVLPLAGVIADTYGWEAVFYVTGALALFWTACWFLLIHNKPDQHPRISQQEKTYINRSIAADNHEKKSSDKVRTPWAAMLTSLPLWAIACASFAGNWGNFTLMSMLPTYMSTILKFDLKSSSALSALPLILQWILTLVGGYVTDVIRRKRLLTTVAVRKLNTTLGLVVPAVFVVLAGYVGCAAKTAVAFFCISVMFIALGVPGCAANAIDIAPKYGGIIYSITNTFANIPGFLAPQVVGLLLQDGNNLKQWQTVFWVSAAVYVTAAVVYLVLGSADEQPWAKGKIVSKKQDEGIFAITRF